jgi:hypothetical protein
MTVMGGASLAELFASVQSARMERPSSNIVMAGPVPAIHVLLRRQQERTRHEAGHDGDGVVRP